MKSLMLPCSSLLRASERTLSLGSCYRDRCERAFDFCLVSLKIFQRMESSVIDLDPCSLISCLELALCVQYDWISLNVIE